MLRKTYYSPPLLFWRTAFRRSRARREFDNLQALVSAGIPCVQPIEWYEHRKLGCVTSSVIVTAYLSGTSDLRAILRARSEPAASRREICVRLGKVLRQLHGHGFVSTTASPRNVLVSGDRQDMSLCDQPFLIHLGTGALATRLAQVDLFDVFFSPSRRRQWSTIERWRGVRAYSGGDREAARALWRQMTGRRDLSFKIARELTRLLAHFFKPPRPAKR